MQHLITKDSKDYSSECDDKENHMMLQFKKSIIRYDFRSYYCWECSTILTKILQYFTCNMLSLIVKVQEQEGKPFQPPQRE